MQGQHLELGNAILTPEEPVEAGSYATVTLCYTAGHPIDDTGYVKIVFRYATDMGRPQFTDPAAANYCTVHTSGDCRIEPRWDPKGHTRPWGAALYLKIMGGYLDTGETLTVVFGDSSCGSPGWRMQTFCEDTLEFKTLVDPIATYEFKELSESPTLCIRPGRPSKAVCIAPSQVEVGKGFTYVLKLEDRWGNPVADPASLAHEGCAQAGVQTVSSRDAETGLSARSNPVKATAAASGLLPFWADFHGQSEETIGTNTIEDYYRFARDRARVDICAHQGNDFQITDDFWQTVNETAKAFNVPGRFVTFPGYEWSGNTPLGGDRNVYFVSEGGRICHSCTDLLPGQVTAFDVAQTADALFANLSSQTGPAAFALAHVGGRYADVARHDPDIEIAVEVHSAWGTFEWLVRDALARGYRIGICANSDGHKGRPGASYPGARTFGSYGGLTCVLAPSLDREAVVDALRARHFYATTGNRCLVDVRVTDEAGQSAMMGDVFERVQGTPVLVAEIAGTGPIESVEVRNGLTTLACLRPSAGAELGARIKIAWSGAEVRGRDRKSAWDGRLTVRDNGIEDVVPINFWNPERQVERPADNVLEWSSITTGGLSGIILTLTDAAAGTLQLATEQCDVCCPLEGLGVEPRSWDCGGLEKKLEVYRLPADPPPCEFSFEFALDDLHDDDNPIYIRVMQEDGHMAWTSPVYLMR